MHQGKQYVADSESKSKLVLDRIASSATEDEKKALALWADSLLAIKESKAPTAKKLADALSTTAKFSTIKPLISLIGKELTPRELSELSDNLTTTYKSGLAPTVKLKQGVSLTGKALKELGWDNRGWTGRLGIATAIATAVLLGGQSAGIAALGTAVGVPLWVIFGAGGAFLGEIIERFTGKPRVEASYTVIEAKKRKNDA
jgi:hypothetical protein